VSTPRDDDALSWGGDDDPTLDVGHRPAADTATETPAETASADPAALPDGYTAVGKGSDTAVPAEVGTDEPAQMSNVMLVTLGILAGAYLLFTVGWIIGGLRLQGTAVFLVSPLGYAFAFWLAVAAPAVWFLTTFLLTRESKAWIRILLLIGGLALLVPWPFILVGAVGQ